MVERSHDPILGKYKIRTKSHVKVIQSYLQDLPFAESDTSVVFLCGDQRVAVNFGVAMWALPGLQTLLGASPGQCWCNHFLGKDAKLWVTLEQEEDARILRMLLTFMVNGPAQEDLLLANEDFRRLREFMRMFQVDDDMFTFNVHQPVVSPETIQTEVKEEAAGTNENKSNEFPMSPHESACLEAPEVPPAAPVTLAEEMHVDEESVKSANGPNVREDEVVNTLSTSPVHRTSQPVKVQKKQRATVSPKIKKNAGRKKNKIDDVNSSQFQQVDHAPDAEESTKDPHATASPTIKKRVGRKRKNIDDVIENVAAAAMKRAKKGQTVTADSIDQEVVNQNLQSDCANTEDERKKSEQSRIHRKNVKKTSNDANDKKKASNDSKERKNASNDKKEVKKASNNKKEIKKASNDKKQRKNTSIDKNEKMRKNEALEAIESSADNECKESSESSAVNEGPRQEVTESSVTLDETLPATAIEDPEPAGHESYIEPTVEIPSENEPMVPMDSTEVAMGLQPMASLPGPSSEFPHPIASSSIAVATLPGPLEEFPKPLATSSTRDSAWSKDCPMVETSTTNTTPVDTDNGLMEDNRDDNTANVVKSNNQDDQKQADGNNAQDFQCRFCTSRSFESKPDLLQHLSLIHFNKNLLERFPFMEGGKCPIEGCEMTSSSRSEQLVHVGKFHEVVIKLMEASSLQVPDKALLNAQGEENASQQDDGTEESVEKVENEVAKVKDAEEQKEDDITSNETEVSTSPSKVSTAIKNPGEDSKEGNMEKVKIDEVPLCGDVDTTKKEDSSVQCPFCIKDGKTRTFDKKSEFLKHISLIHYGRQILQKFPFKDGQSCSICLESPAKKEYRASKKELHVCHVAILHQKLFDLIPKEVEQMIQDMPAAKKSEVKEKAPVAGSLACKYCDQTVLRRDMKDHLISHKELIAAQRNNQEAAADSAASVINLKMSSK